MNSFKIAFDNLKKNKTRMVLTMIAIALGIAILIIMMATSAGLKKMVLRNNKSKLIYTFSHNTSSIRGLEKAGFKILGSIKGYNKNKYLSLIK